MTAARTVFVTGASRGIGLHIAEGLLKAGYDVTGVARSCTKQFAALSAEHGRRAQLIEADLSTARDLQLVARHIAGCQTTYALVNNAGQASAGLHMIMPRARLDTLVAVNLMAPMVLSQAATRAMLRRRAGRIVNITSICARRPFRGLAAYSATKAALEGFTRVLAAECGGWGITANCVAPGFVETDMTAELEPHVVAHIRRRGMLHTPPAATDVSNVVEFLLSDQARAITAEVIRVDSGSAA